MSHSTANILAKSMRIRQEHGWTYDCPDIEAEARRVAEIVGSLPAPAWIDAASAEISKIERRATDGR